MPCNWLLARFHLGSEKSSHTRGSNPAKTSHNSSYTSSVLDELELTPWFLELTLSIKACRGFTSNSRSYTIGPDPEVDRTADKGMASYMIPDHTKKGGEREEEAEKREYKGKN